MLREHRKGLKFTLVELLIVIAVIAILAAMLLPALTRARAVAKSIKCAANQKQLLTAAISYADGNNGFWVPLRWRLSGWSSASMWTLNAELLTLFDGHQRTVETARPVVATSSFIPTGLSCPESRYDPGPGAPAGTTDISRNYAMSWTGFYGNGFDLYANPINASYQMNKIKSSSASCITFCGMNWSTSYSSSNYSTYLLNGEKYDGTSTLVAYRHQKRANVGCFDGHVQTMSGTELYSGGNDGNATPMWRPMN